MKYAIALLGLAGGVILGVKFFGMVDWYWWQEGLVGLFLGMFVANQAGIYVSHDWGKKE